MRLIQQPQSLTVLNNLAVAHYFLGQYEEAERQLGAILDHPALVPQLATQARNNRGLLYQEMGRLDQARLEFDKARSLAGADRRLRAQILNNQARVFGLESNLVDAESALQEAYQLAQAEGDFALEANILDSWGEVLAAAGQLQKALEKLDAAAAAEATARAPVIRVAILNNQARVLGQLARASEGLAAAEQALKLAGEMGLVALRREALATRGELHRSAGNLEAAIVDYREAIKLVEETRERLWRESERDFIRATQRLYEALVSALLQRNRSGDVDQALRVLEQSRSATLQQAMVGSRPELRDKQAERDVQGARGLFIQEAALARQLQARLAASLLDGEEIDKLRGRLTEIRTQVSTAITELQQRYQGLYDAYVPYPISPMLFRDLKEQLPPRHLLVTFFLAEDAVYVFLVSREDGVEFRQNRMVTKRELEQKIADYRRLMTPQRGANRAMWRIDSWADAQWVALRETTAWLYRSILEPIADRIDKADAIVFAPTGLLYYLPLHALGPFDENTGVLQVLALTKPVSYLTTAALFKAITVAPLAERQPARWDALLALGNPPFLKLRPLPNAEIEVAALEAVFGDQAVVLRGPAATKGALLARLGAAGPGTPTPGQFTFLHLATHGVLDAKSPKDSYLALDAGNRLAAYEVASLDLRGVSLVTLSACETALADQTPGAELMSLAQFFFMAGAQSVLVTLWAVDDAETANLMKHFYEDLKRSPTEKARAVQQAQVALMSRPESRHPYFWAPFILIGAPR
jgi:CHAT domain-containing protein